MIRELINPAATDQFAALVAARFTQHYAESQRRCCIFLYGPLGAGKSSFARALLRSLGVSGAIKSPTYTLVEPYELPIGLVLHLDLYRLSDGAELEYLGLRESFDSAKLLLVEWPERALLALPKPDLALHFDYAPNDPEQRIVRIDGDSAYVGFSL